MLLGAQGDERISPDEWAARLGTIAYEVGLRPRRSGRAPLRRLLGCTDVTVVALTTSVDETRELAAALVALARPGDVLVLAGDLGAGKTAFVQGFGRGLGVAERITSPTFTLVHVYEGRLPVHHLDVYRLEQLSEVLDLGLAEMLDDGGVVLIEWGDADPPRPARTTTSRCGSPSARTTTTATSSSSPIGPGLGARARMHWPASCRRGRASA